MLCQYKDIFGKIGEGVHSYRFLNIAIVDLLATIVIAYGIHWTFKINFLIVFVALIFLGIISHRIFCVRTTIDKILF
jgi:hypothetical protein